MGDHTLEGLEGVLDVTRQALADVGAARSAEGVAR
jgi:hypothetical protein